MGQIETFIRICPWIKLGNTQGIKIPNLICSKEIYVSIKLHRQWMTKSISIPILNPKIKTNFSPNVFNCFFVF